MIADVFDFVSEAWDATGGKVVDVASDVFEALPVSGPLRDLVNGPLRDFAKTPVGLTVLRALASSFYGPLSWTLGPQLATLAWATPGLFRGEPFEKAWFDEVKWRAEKTGEMLAPGAYEAQLNELLGKLAKELGPGEFLVGSVQEIAKRFGVRDDVAAMGRAFWNKLELPGREDFDPVSGRQRVPRLGTTAFDVSKLQTQVAGTAAKALALSSARGGVQDAQTVVASKALAGRGWVAPELVVSAPASVAAGAPPGPRKAAGDVLLVVTVGAAAAALVWFYVGER